MSWIITSHDLNATHENKGFGPFYFVVSDKKSNELNITLIDEALCSGISRCSDYKTQDYCKRDNEICNVAYKSNPQCGKTGNNSESCMSINTCSCEWTVNSTSGSCGVSIVNSFDSTCSDIFSIGKCIFTELTNDDCDDGFLTYLIKAKYEWDSDNFNTTNISGNYWVENPKGVWHYDPQTNQHPKGAFADCMGEETQVKCPAQKQLPFFGIYNLIASFMFIAIAYLVISLRKR